MTKKPIPATPAQADVLEADLRHLRAPQRPRLEDDVDHSPTGDAQAAADGDPMSNDDDFVGIILRAHLIVETCRLLPVQPIDRAAIDLEAAGATLRIAELLRLTPDRLRAFGFEDQADLQGYLAGGVPDA